MIVVELVRHAQAGKRGDWHGPDEERPLDETGRMQAARLADELRPGAPIAAIISSGFTRCTQTMEPLAGAVGLSVQTHAALEEVREVPVADGGRAWVTAGWLGGRVLALLDELFDRRPARLILCTHGDVIPAFMSVLVGRDDLGIPDVRCPKGGRFRLEFSKGRCVAARAVAAPDVAAPDVGAPDVGGPDVGGFA